LCAWGFKKTGKLEVTIKRGRKGGVFPLVTKYKGSWACHPDYFGGERATRELVGNEA